MTDEAKALVDAVDRYVRVYTTGSSDGAKYRARKNLMDLIETQAREIERLREALGFAMRTLEAEGFSDDGPTLNRIRAALAGEQP